MKNPAEKLSKTLAYILERRPDEFGLVTDSQGFVKIKDLLKALEEEREFCHVRRAFLEEILLTVPDAPFEIRGGLIRAKDRTCLESPALSEAMPPLLYTCVRRKAYSVILEKGISPASHPMVVLSSDREMATRIGRRSDASPVLLTVPVALAREAGVRFLSAGGSLYLAEAIPASLLSGPPLRRVQGEPPTRESRELPPAPKHPGSFFPDPAGVFAREGGMDQKERRRGRPEWKRDRKKMQRMERKKGPHF